MKNFAKKTSALFLALCLMLSVAACGGASKPKDVAESYVKELAAGNFDKADELASGFSVFGGLEATDGIKDAFKALCNKMAFKAGEEKVDGDSATVKGTLTVLDVASAMQEMTQEEMMGLASEEDMYKLIAEKAKSVSDTKEAEVTFVLEKKDGKWLVSNIEGFDTAFAAMS